MKNCPDCGSTEQFQSNSTIETTTISGDLLPKLGSGMFASAKVRPVVCGDCGYLRFYVADEALAKMRDADNWKMMAAGPTAGSSLGE